MSSSEDESTYVSDVPSKVPLNIGKGQGKKKETDTKMKATGANQGRSWTPTKQDQRQMQYIEEEARIPKDHKMVVREGWSNSLMDVGLVYVKEKRSDDGKRTYQGINLTVFSSSKSRMEGTSIRLATNRADKQSNRLILTVPKLDDSTKKHKKGLIKSQKKSHGKCESRDEGIRRSFNKVLPGEVKHYELIIDGVGNLINSEWQGDKFKQDPCYLKVTRDVVG
jgi:hypothetical protein